MCVACRRKVVEDSMLGCWDWREGDVSCGGLDRDGVCGVGDVVREVLYEEVVEVRRVSDRVMAVVLVFEEGVLR